MSCFGGLMEEYKYLSIDRFDGENLSSSAFFLSHLHTDHIVGLPEREFQKRLETGKHIYLYTSEVTKSLLLADTKFINLEKYIVPLPLEKPVVIKITHFGQTSSVAVTLISAAHCPGSVMFLFEGDEGNVLYTGDFRLPKGSAKRIRPFHMFNKMKKSIKSIYVDTTFCSENAVFIPKREDCVASLTNLVQEWLAEDKNNVVRLNLSAKYGYEFLLIALNKALKCKIFCCRRDLYRNMPQVYHMLTNKLEFSRIFAGLKTDKFGLESRDLNMMKIILSTYHFTKRALPDQVYDRVSDDTYRFCFSFHSSYSEVCDFVKYVNPDNVYANVIPFCKTPLETVARNVTLKCGLKPRKFNDIHIEPAVSDVERLNSAQTAHVLKRALSYSLDEDDDTQDYCDRIIDNAKKKHKNNPDQCENVQRDKNVGQKDGITTVREDMTSNPGHSCPSIAFSVPTSPNCKAPTQSEIDMLHVKLVVSGDSQT